VAENVARLKALFPELVTEGPNGASVNVDVLKQLVGDRTVTDLPAAPGAAGRRRGEVRPELARQASRPAARADALHRHPASLPKERLRRAAKKIREEIASRGAEKNQEMLFSEILRVSAPLLESDLSLRVFCDSAFANDVAKTNMAAILEQNGIANVRSL
jgi:hypothetical protein